MSRVEGAGDLDWLPVGERTDLVATSVAQALAGWSRGQDVRVAAIDPDLADTAALVEATGMPASVCANCVVVAGRRGGEERVAACVVLATTRADVNGVVRRLLDARKASFMGQDDAVGRTGMEYGGITPVGLPDGWRVLVDAAAAAAPLVVVGSGVRASKLLLPGSALAELPGAEVVDSLARPVG